jgi:hypothetical protein
MSETGIITLISKIAKAAMDVGGKLGVDRTNKDANYDYISADKILSICGQALYSQGVVVIPNIGEQDTVLFEYTDQYGKARRRFDSTVNFQFTITDGITEAKHNWFGMGCDYTVPDKALYKAITSGHKYFLMKLLCIGAGNEDGEHEGDEDDGKTKSVKRHQDAPPIPHNGAGQAQPAAVGNATEKPWTSMVVSLELAKSIKTTPKRDDTGTPYWDLPTDKLSTRYDTMVVYLKDHPELPQKTQENYQLKIDVAKAILDYRIG